MTAQKKISRDLKGAIASSRVWRSGAVAKASAYEDRSRPPAPVTLPRLKFMGAPVSDMECKRDG